MRHTLSRCGHEVIVGEGSLKGGKAINVFLELFPDRSLADFILTAKKQNSLIVGAIATEIVIDGKIPYAEHGIALGSEDRSLRPKYFEDRVRNFDMMAHHLDFIWCFFERAVAEYRDKCPFVTHWPFGHLQTLPRDWRRSPKDIDVVFFGAKTPHRARTVEMLTNSGISVAAAGSGWPGGWLSPCELESLLDRAKIGLNLTLHAEHEREGVVDPRFVSPSRVVELLEREVCVVSEQIPEDNPFSSYMIEAPITRLAQSCRDLIDDGKWQAIGLDCARRYRDDMDALKVCKPVVDRTIAALKSRHSI